MSVISNNFGRAFCIVFIILEISAVRIDAESQNSVDITFRQPIYYRHGNSRSRRNYFALQRNAVVNLTDLGVLQGSIGETQWSKTPIYRFLGIKFAESPSGNRRFKVKSHRGDADLNNVEISNV